MAHKKKQNQTVEEMHAAAAAEQQAWLDATVESASMDPPNYAPLSSAAAGGAGVTFGTTPEAKYGAYAGLFPELGASNLGHASHIQNFHNNINRQVNWWFNNHSEEEKNKLLSERKKHEDQLKKNMSSKKALKQSLVEMWKKMGIIVSEAEYDKFTSGGRRRRKKRRRKRRRTKKRRKRRRTRRRRIHKKRRRTRKKRGGINYCGSGWVPTTGGQQNACVTQCSNGNFRGTFTTPTGGHRIQVKPNPAGPGGFCLAPYHNVRYFRDWAVDGCSNNCGTWVPG